MRNATTLSECIEVRRGSDGIVRDKLNGTKVTYHIFREYEIHSNELAPNSIQEWHHHERIIETLYVLEGVITIHWIDIVGVQQSERIRTGDIVDVGGTVHTFSNAEDRTAKFIVFRLVPDGSDKRQIIKNDRFADKVD